MSGNYMKDALEAIGRDGVPENISLWPRIAARVAERKPMMTMIRTRPAAAIGLALLALLALSSAAYAVGRSLGYVPGIGFVENTDGLRALEKPVSVTREGVTLTVSQAIVYKDHVKLVYEVSGVPPAAQVDPANAGSGAASCIPPDAAPRLRLPDGTIVERAKQDIYEQQPTFLATIPAGVDELTMLLTCLPHTYRGAAPENWEVPLPLVYKPAHTIVGEPVTQPAPQPTIAGAAPPSATSRTSPDGGHVASTGEPFEPDYRFGGAIGLAQPEVTRQGDRVEVCLKWLSLAPVTVDYNIFVHLLSDEAALLGQMDFNPQEGRAPTSSWLPGEARAECVTLDGPGLPAHGWHIALGLYDPAAGVRLPVSDRSGQPLPNDEIVISPE